MLTTVYFIRHGQKAAAPGDPDLTSLGIKQAEQTAHYFKNFKINALYASPYQRTIQTAKIIASQLNLPVHNSYLLRERLNWEKGTFADFWQEWQKTDLNRNYQPLSGRSSFQTGKEVKNFIDQLDLHKNQSIIIVTHGGTIGDFLRVAFPVELLPQLINQESGAKYLNILECSITEIETNNRQYILKRINFTRHLK